MVTLKNNAALIRVCLGRFRWLYIPKHANAFSQLTILHRIIRSLHITGAMWFKSQRRESKHFTVGKSLRLHGKHNHPVLRACLGPIVATVPFRGDSLFPSPFICVKLGGDNRHSLTPFSQPPFLPHPPFPPSSLRMCLSFPL